MSRPAGELDSILDDALSEYEEGKVDADTSIAAAAARAAQASETLRRGAATPAADDADPAIKSALERMMADMKDPEFQSILDETLKEMTAAAVGSGELPGSTMGASARGGAGASTPGAAAAAATPRGIGGVAAASALFSTLAPEGGAAGADGFTRTLEMLSHLAREQKNAEEGGADATTSFASGGGGGGGVKPGMEGLPPTSAAAAEGLSEEVIARMVDEFEKLGGKDDFNAVLEGMMKQLLTKDLMYTPMKQICEKFPGWLARNRSSLPKPEYEKFGKQYQCFQQLVMTYETDPDNFSRITALMQDLQEYGNPPAEIITEIAPGIELTADGIPTLPNMGPGIPGVPLGMGVEGMPAACVIS